jgi:hypothetical protein
MKRFDSGPRGVSPPQSQVERARSVLKRTRAFAAQALDLVLGDQALAIRHCG